jgi:choline dehydrogenase
MSKGRIQISSSNPLEYPKIYANYLSDKRDQQVVIDCIKVARKISEVPAPAPALASCVTDEYVPGRQFQTNEELLQAARDRSQTIYHPSCTCAMGHDDMAVVDDLLRAHGTQSLRVVDTSIIPEITSCNTNAPYLMIAEKAADMIKEDAFST